MRRGSNLFRRLFSELTNNLFQNVQVLHELGSMLFVFDRQNFFQSSPRGSYVPPLCKDPRTRIFTFLIDLVSGIMTKSVLDGWFQPCPSPGAPFAAPGTRTEMVAKRSPLQNETAVNVGWGHKRKAEPISLPVLVKKASLAAAAICQGRLMQHVIRTYSAPFLLYLYHSVMKIE